MLIMPLFFILHFLVFIRKCQMKHKLSVTWCRLCEYFRRNISPIWYCRASNLLLKICQTCKNRTAHIKYFFLKYLQTVVCQKLQELWTTSLILEELSYNYCGFGIFSKWITGWDTNLLCVLQYLKTVICPKA